MQLLFNEVFELSSAKKLYYFCNRPISIVELQRIVRGVIARTHTGRKLKILKEETINSNNNRCCRFQSKKCTLLALDYQDGKIC